MRKRYFGDCFSTLLLPPLEQLLLVGERPLLSLLEKAIPEKLPSMRKRYFGDCLSHTATTTTRTTTASSITTTTITT